MIKEYFDYLRDNPQGYWFKAKVYGWGWTPAKWQGWVLILIYLLFVLFFAFRISSQTDARGVMLNLIVPILVLTAALISICYKTGEKPRWQWGIPKPSQPNQVQNNSQNNSIK